MSIKLVRDLIRVTALVFGLTFVTALAARASDSDTVEPPAPPFTTDAMQLSSEPIELALPEAKARIASEENAVADPVLILPGLQNDVANQHSVSNPALPDNYKMNEIVGEDDQAEHFQAQLMQPGATQVILDTVSYLPVEHPEETTVNVVNDREADYQFNSLYESEIEEILTENHLSNSAAINSTAWTPAEAMQLADVDWSLAQAAPEPDEPESEPTLDQTDQTNGSAAPRWRFIFQPYGFVPLSVEGDVEVRDLTAEINLGLDDILSPLNFAAAGRLEAWRGNLGFIFDAAYFSVEQEISRSRSGLDCFACIFPSEIDTETKARYGQFDLGVGYRFASVNPSEAVTEFDLGPLVFDAIVGLRVYAIQAEIDVSTNLGTSLERERSETIWEPLVSGRIRWNVSPNLAGWVRGDIAGLGIQETVFAASFTGGLEWMFSGDTSLLLAYRVSSLQYNSDNDLELDLLLHGPYLGMVFRF